MGAFELKGQAAECPQEGLVLDEGGVWREVFRVDAEGRPTTDATKAVAETLIPPPDGDVVYRPEMGDWAAAVKLESKGGRPLMEHQYIDGIFSKTNYERSTPEFWPLVEQMMAKTALPEVPFWISLRGDKYTAYLHDRKYLASVQPEFGFPDTDIPVAYALSVYGDGSRSLKIYVPRENYTLPTLPAGSRVYAGVATNWRDGKQSGPTEVFFEAGYAETLEWCTANGLVMPPGDPAFFGVDFEDGKILGKFRAVQVVKQPRGEVERCWVAGECVRIGYDFYSPQGIEIAGKLNNKWIVNISNIGINSYPLGEIISMYNGSITVPDKLRQLFRVPETISPPQWYAIKYCPALDLTWLKLSDMNYQNYSLPGMPEGATRAFGVATTYPEKVNQPPAHNMEGMGWLDCSFITKNHAAVRDWCMINNLPDPKPDLPDLLGDWGVYSLTFNQSSGAIGKIKFYSYTGQRAEMNCYLDSVVAAGSDKPSQVKIIETVKAFNTRGRI